MKLAALLCLAATASGTQTGPTSSVYTDLQAWAKAALVNKLEDVNDQELLDGLLSDVGGYEWHTPNARTVEIPLLQQWATTELKAKLDDSGDTLLDALLSDLRRYQWTVRQ